MLFSFPCPVDTSILSTVRHRIKNMMLLRRGGSALLLKPRIPKDRRCVTCGSPEGHGDWSKTEDGYVCSLCVTEARRANLKRAKDFDDYLRIVETAEKVLFDPNFKPPDLRPKITVVVIPRDEKSRINALRRARLRRKQRERQRRNLSTGRERDEYNALWRAKIRTLNPSMHFYVAPPSRW